MIEVVRLFDVVCPHCGPIFRHTVPVKNVWELRGALVGCVCRKCETGGLSLRRVKVGRDCSRKKIDSATDSAVSAGVDPRPAPP
jgi:hypothetical protein